MKCPSARRLMSAGVVAAAGAFALAMPGAASATLGEQCSGSDIEAQGSSLQHLAQIEEWNPAFNTSASSLACNGKQGSGGKPTVKYNSTGSGAGLHAFGAEGFTPNYTLNAFVGTDEAPNPEQKEEIEEHEIGYVKSAEKKSLETIPILQAAVAIDIHLPADCVANSTAAPGRLALNWSTIEGIYRGSINKWSEIKDDGDTVSGVGCDAETPIYRVVRRDHSGTTHLFKAFLFEENPATFEAEKYPTSIGGVATCATEKEPEPKTWRQVGEGCENQRWPAAAAVHHAAIATGPGVVQEVAEVESSIGYAGLAESRASRTDGGFIPAPEGSGGANTGKFWAVLENRTKKGAPKSYSDPSTDGDADAKANANCKKTVYSDGEHPFPPENTRALWYRAVGELEEKDYSLCGLTYDEALREYSKYSGTSEAEATTVSNYLLFAINKKGGSPLINGSDFEALPKSVARLSAAGAAEITY